MDQIDPYNVPKLFRGVPRPKKYPEKYKKCIKLTLPKMEQLIFLRSARRRRPHRYCCLRARSARPFVCGVNVGGLLCGTSIESIESIKSIESIESVESSGSIESIESIEPIESIEL